jgi:large subunit ribosomal protein L1
MSEFDEQFKAALEEIRSSAKERKFDETVDFIMNLQKFDLKKTPINLFVTIPHKTKKKKVAGFLETKSEFVDTITEADFPKYKDKKKLKNLVKKYDFFIAQAKLMPKVATTFGRVLGPAGKMPSPQLGILLNADEKSINEVKEKVNIGVKIRAKESSIKLGVGKKSMSDVDLIENINSIYNEVLKALPRDKENIKNLEVKFTMSKPIKIKVR